MKQKEHKTQRESLVIVRKTELKGDLEHDAKRRQIKQVAKYDSKFPLLHKRIRPAPAFRKVSFKTCFININQNNYYSRISY